MKFKLIIIGIMVLLTSAVIVISYKLHSPGEKEKPVRTQILTLSPGNYYIVQPLHNIGFSGSGVDSTKVIGGADITTILKAYHAGNDSIPYIYYENPDGVTIKNINGESALIIDLSGDAVFNCNNVRFWTED